MTVNLEGLDDKPACLVVPLYRTTFVEQPLVGSVTIQDQELKNEKRKSFDQCYYFFILNLSFFYFQPI
jgi:hypothetical protein